MQRTHKSVLGSVSVWSSIRPDESGHWRGRVALYCAERTKVIKGWLTPQSFSSSPLPFLPNGGTQNYLLRRLVADYWLLAQCCTKTSVWISQQNLNYNQSLTIGQTSAGDADEVNISKDKIKSTLREITPPKKVFFGNFRIWGGGGCPSQSPFFFYIF